jgi:hypothetical protein
VVVTGGVVMHLPMFWMGRFNHFHLADMPMDDSMTWGVAPIVGGIGVAAYGLLPRRVAQLLSLLALVPGLFTAALAILVPVATALALVWRFGVETRGRDLRDFEST